MSEGNKEQHRTGRIGWLRAAVLGANDGILSTSSLVLGVAAAHATHSNVLVAGVAGLVAGAMSMAAGEYVSVHSQADTEQAELERERAELKADDKGEHQELMAIYVARGLDPSLAKQVAEQLMRNALAAWRDWRPGASLPLLSLHLSGAVLRTAGMARLLNGLIGASGLDRQGIEFEADSLPSVLTLDAPQLTEATESAVARLGLEQRVAQALASGLRVVAGGVDSLLEWQLAKELGCDVAQGEFIAAPMPLKGLPTALNFWRSSYRALSAPDFFDL